MAMTIKTIEGNTSGGSTLVANGGTVAKKSYSTGYSRIAEIWLPRYRAGEAQKVVNEAKRWVGYLEKKSNSQLEHFTANAGYNNYTYFAKKLKEWGIFNFQGQAWCDMFVDFVFIQALGKERAMELLGGFSAYTPTSASLLKSAGATKQEAYNANGGAIIFFKNSTRICHTGIVDGVIVDNPPVEQIYDNKAFLSDVYAILGVSTPEAALKKTVTISRKRNKTHGLVLPVQKFLKTMGLYKGVPDRDFGPLSEDAVNDYQALVLGYRAPDGEITARNKMWKSLLGLL